MSETALAKASPQIERLKGMLAEPSIEEQFKNALREHYSTFLASIVELVGSDNNLQQCDPKLIIMECLKAATLGLPLNATTFIKSLLHRG